MTFQNFGFTIILIGGALVLSLCKVSDASDMAWHKHTFWGDNPMALTEKGRVEAVEAWEKSQNPKKKPEVKGESEIGKLTSPLPPVRSDTDVDD